MLEVGKKAPAFTLKNQKGKKIALTDFLGEKNVILYFYPRAMTPGCTVQAKGLKDNKSKLAKKDTVILGVSTDETEKLSRFEEKYGLNFNLLSDPDHLVASKYEVWAPKKFMGKEFLGVKRVTFIIGKDGKIKHILDKVKTKTHHQDVLALV